jgi:hypothetical protein
VRDVEFLATKPGPKYVSYEADNTHTPFIRRRRA